MSEPEQDPGGAGSTSGGGDRARIPVLFIGGVGRSGSTLLDLMLGQVPGLCAVGELSYLWFRADEDLCGCGEAFVRCPFWSAVGASAFGGWDQIDREHVLALRTRLDRHRNIPTLALGSPDRVRREFGRYMDVMRRLYEGIRSVSGAEIIVDSTKNASSAFLLRRTPGIDVRIVHLVRDSRAVAYSWTKEVRKPGIAGGPAYMDRYSASRTSGRWMTYNALFHVLRTLRVPTIRMRYEDLVRDPEAQLRRILPLLGREPVPEFAFLGPDGIRVHASHTIAGNPMRFRSGAMPLRIDDEWTRRLPTRDRTAVTALTWPLLVAYRYLPREERSPGAGAVDAASRA